jgi:hypothetical protein
MNFFALLSLLILLINDVTLIPRIADLMNEIRWLATLICSYL